jgi:Tfp pilus assembly protein PilZ
MPGAGGRSEKRRSKRRRVRLAVKFWNELGEHAGFSSDISGNGMFLETIRVLPIGVRLHLEIDTPSGPFFAEGQVARIVRATAVVQPVKLGGLGLRFVGLEEAIASITSEPDTTTVPEPLAESLPEREHTGALLELDLRDRDALSLVFDRDVKQAGLFVRTDTPPARDSSVVVRLLLPAPNPPIEVDGTVVQVMAQPKGVAVQLHEVDPLSAKLSAILGR